jgi:hypothetical protein
VKVNIPHCTILPRWVGPWQHLTYIILFSAISHKNLQSYHAPPRDVSTRHLQSEEPQGAHFLQLRAMEFNIFQDVSTFQYVGVCDIIIGVMS